MKAGGRTVQGFGASRSPFSQLRVWKPNVRVVAAGGRWAAMGLRAGPNVRPWDMHLLELL